MLERLLGVPGSPAASVVFVVGADDDLGVYSVDELDLLGSETGSVDSEGVYADVVERNSVECALAEIDDSSLLGGVVEEETPNIDSTRVEVLRARSSVIACTARETSAYHAQYPSPLVSEGVSDAVTLTVPPELEVLSRIVADPLGPVRMDVSSGVSDQPGL